MTPLRAEPRIERAEPRTVPTAPKYSVVALDPTAARDEVMRIWRDNLQLTASPSARFDWVYRDTPERPSRVYLLRATMPRSTAGIVGTAGIAERRFEARSGTLRAAHLVDLAVDGPHRSLFPALSLVRAVRSAALQSHDFAYGFPNAAARGVFRRAGYQSLAPMTRWARVLRFAPYLKERFGFIAAPRTSGAILDGAFRARQLRRWLRASAQFELELCTDVDDRFDELWARAHGELELVAWRGARFLRWRFLHESVSGCRLFALRRRGRRRDVSAYAVVQRQGPTAHVRDIFGHRAALGALLDLLLPRLRKEGAHSASLMFLGPRSIQEMFRLRGFSPRENERIAFFDTASATLTRQLADPDRWYLTDADDDT